MTGVEAVFSEIANYIVLSGIIPLLLFVFFYSKSRWFETAVGRALMVQKAAFISIFVLLILGKFFPEVPGRGYAQVAIYGFVVFTFWQVFYTLIVTQRATKRDEKEPPTDR